MGDADQPGGGHRPEIAPVETVRRRIDQEDFAGPDDAAAEPDRQRPAGPVARQRVGDGPAIDGHEDARATDARAGERGNALEKRHAARQVFAPRHIDGEISWRFDRDPIADHGRGAGIDAIQTDRRALARIP